MFLHRDDYHNKDDEEVEEVSATSETLIRIAKHRNGALADIYMEFEKKTGRFYERETRYN